jgi:hypothetical protein
MADTWLDVITDALVELGVYEPGDPISAGHAQFVGRKLNIMLDRWSARKSYVYAVTFPTFTLTPGHAPHLIGPGLTAPDLAVLERPVRLEGANLILNTSTPNVDTPIGIRDEAWWNNQRVKSLSSDVPTDVYYAPSWPNGTLNFWPVPDFAYGLRLEVWSLITGIPLDGDGNPNFTATFSMPPAYQEAVTLTLSESIAGAMAKEISSDLARRAMRARSDMQSNNAKSPRTSSADWGTRGRPRGDFNYYSGMPS